MRATGRSSEGIAVSQLLQLYLKLGNDRFPAAITELAPYFGTIAPRFHGLRPGYCSLDIANTRAVQNHLGTLHAIAMCNGAELAAGLTTDVSIPEGRRWIPVEMNVRYLAMAKTDVRVVCDGGAIDWGVIGDIQVPISITDTAGVEVVRASITMKISPGK
jgi:acyl-coenzyme A thioesterase PaaI-like protein